MGARLCCPLLVGCWICLSRSFLRASQTTPSGSRATPPRSRMTPSSPSPADPTPGTAHRRSHAHARKVLLADSRRGRVQRSALCVASQGGTDGEPLRRLQREDRGHVRLQLLGGGHSGGEPDFGNAYAFQPDPSGFPPCGSEPFYRGCLQVLLPHLLNDPTEFGSLQDLFCISRKEGCVHGELGGRQKRVPGLTALSLPPPAGTWEVCGCCRPPVRSSISSAPNKGRKHQPALASRGRILRFLLEIK